MSTISYTKNIKMVLDFLLCLLHHGLINGISSIGNSLFQVSYVSYLCSMHNILHVTPQKETQGSNVAERPRNPTERSQRE